MPSSKINRASVFASMSLGKGGHSDISDGMCAMEAVAYLAGERWSDSPICACPVIGEGVKIWQDSLPDDGARDRLVKPLVPRLVGTRSTPAVEKRRAFMTVDWLIRVHSPVWLRLTGRKHQADALEELPEISNCAGCLGLTPVFNAVFGGKTTSAASPALWEVVWQAVMAGSNHASSALYIALSTARAGVKVTTVTGGIPSATLHQTVESMQLKTVDLIQKMIEVKP